jgi:hypothetical protein
MPSPRGVRRELHRESAKKNLETRAQFLAWLDTVDKDSSWGRTGSTAGPAARPASVTTRMRRTTASRARLAVPRLATNTCPVLLFTPDVQEIYEWFHAHTN